MTKLSFPPEHSPQLLVSVRDPNEALAALKGGANIIDVKEPRNGSLGKADDQAIEQIVQSVRSFVQNRPVSVALGELRDWQESHTVPRIPSEVDFVKLGFSRCQTVQNWRDRWREFRHRLLNESPTSPDWVAVVYADWKSAEAPPPKDILEAATEIPCVAVLIDTFYKNGQSLVDVLSQTELHTIADHVHHLNLPLALAGSLRIQDLPKLEPLNPQIIAVRSAACLNGQRDAPVCASAVQNFREKLIQSTGNLKSLVGENLTKFPRMPSNTQQSDSSSCLKDSRLPDAH